MDEYRDAQTERFGIQQGDVALDQLEFFQRLDAVETRRWAQVHRSCQFRIGDTGVFLQGRKNGDIGLVETNHE